MKRPNVSVVRKVADDYLHGVLEFEEVLKGKSTYVYRIKTVTGIYYMRLLPGEGTFDGEVLALEKLQEFGVKVPEVLIYQERNEETGLSMMIVREIKGESIEDSGCQLDYEHVIIEAGRQLALMHFVSVDGFGWVEKGDFEELKGEKMSFNEYFTEFLKEDLDTLDRYDFSENDKSRIREYMIMAEERLDVQNAVLVHGDFDISHIFHEDQQFTGIIDFGEIRGNNPLYDLATFVAFYQDRKQYEFLLKGYCEIKPLSEKELFDVELMAMFIILRFLGKKVDTKWKSHFEKLAKVQLEHMDK